MKFLSLQHELPEFRCALATLKDLQRDAQVSTMKTPADMKDRVELNTFAGV